MNTLLNHLTDEAVKELDRFGSKKGSPGNRAFRLLEEVILDDEQQQTLGLRPWNIFFLRAATLLMETDPDNENSGITDQKQKEIISLIRTHACTGDIHAVTGMPPVEYRGEPVNTGLLASAAGLATRLVLDHPHTLGILAADLAGREQIPPDRFMKAVTVTSIDAHPFLSGTIRVRLTCSHPGVHRVLKHHESRVQKLLHQANGLVSPRYLFSEIVFEIKALGYTPLDMKFSVDAMAAMKLLTGNRLYSDKRVFLRELVQNAVDACNLRRMFDTAYEPEISIDFPPRYRTITFRDNGIGMDRQWMEKYFLKIGISFYQSGDSKTIHKSRVDCNFISKFGIGFLSSFLVADHVVIRTRKNNSPGLVIAINTLEDYFDVRFAHEECPRGTEVCLHLSQDNVNFSRSMEYVCYLKTNLRFLTVPVVLNDHEGNTAILGSETLKYEQSKKHGRDFVAALKFQDSCGYLFLKAKQTPDTLYALEYARGGVSIFQDGIFVTQTDTLLPEGARQNIIGRINLTGQERCELSMDRNRIFWTDARLTEIKQKIREAIVDLANMLMDDCRSQTPPLSVEPSLINHLAVFFDFNEINDEMYGALAPPIRRIVAKRFRDFIRINFAHTGEKKHVPDADGYGEQWQQDILAAFAKRGRPPMPEQGN
ncbi:MAG: ATP-binding protein [Desulfobacterales bacterium]|nr:ATP-binding protein [Desulfobacterales bacterium]